MSAKGKVGLANYELTSLLEEYAELFAKPIKLPPSRTHDQTIPIKEGSQLIALRPYRYPPLQKAELDRQITESLEVGVIGHHQSPYSSRALLVKKRWIMENVHRLQSSELANN